MESMEILNILFILTRDKFSSGFVNYMKKHFTMYSLHFVIRDHGREQFPLNLLDYKNIYYVNEYKHILDDANLAGLVNSADKIVISGIFDTMDVLSRFNSKQIGKTYLQFWGGDFYSYRGKAKFYQIRHKWRKRRLIQCCSKCKGLIFLIDGEYEKFKSITHVEKKFFIAPVPGDPLAFQDIDFGVLRAQKNKTKRIVLGNSATQTNNHEEIISILADKKNEKGIGVNCPLAYGDDVYRDKIIEYGKEKLQDAFTPITSFMPYSKYVEFLSTCDVGIFNNDRQQALGNLYALLAMGKKVYIRDDTSMWRFFIEKGIKVYPISDIYKCRDISELFSKEDDISSNMLKAENLLLSLDGKDKWENVFSD